MSTSLHNPSHILEKLPANVLQLLDRLVRSLSASGGRVYLVGGAVRDAFLGEPSVDLDLEVFSIGVERLEAALSRVCRWDAVGKSFGVYKIRGYTVDVALPRRERKYGSGHRGFRIEADPDATLADAASRRDFTVNAILFDLAERRMEDPLGGIDDLQDGILRHCGPQFDEDPLRVLRAAQFIARFNLTPQPETVKRCRAMSLENLPAERIFEEWKKCLLQGRQISKGLRFLEDCGWIRYFPELEALSGCPQDPEWHPEGDVWTHVGHCLDAFALHRVKDPWEDLIVGLAVLCHDIGKPATTLEVDGRIRSKGHPEAGVPIARTFLERLTGQSRLIEEVLPLVKEHHRPLEFYRARASSAAVRRLALRVKRIDRLVRVARADKGGRPPLPPGPFPEGEWLLRAAEELKLREQAPKPIVLGRHLIAEGLVPSPAFRAILDACFEAQLEGIFDTEAGGIAFLRDYLKNGS